MSLPPNEPADPAVISPAKPGCTEDECGRPTVARGLCTKHYQQKWRLWELPPPKQKKPPMVHLRVTLTREQVVQLRREAARRNLELTKLVRDIIGLSLKHLGEQSAQPAQPAQPATR